MSRSAKAKPAAMPSEQVAAERNQLFELALRGAERAVDTQRDELSGMRNRAVAFAAFTGAGTAFLVGAGLGSASKADGFWPSAIIGTALYGAMLIALFATVLPSWPFRFYLDPKVLAGWIEGDAPAPSRAVFLRQLVNETYPTMLTKNERSLKGIRWSFRLVLGFGAAALALWAITVWLFT